MRFQECIARFYTERANWLLFSTPLEWLASRARVAFGLYDRHECEAGVFKGYVPALFRPFDRVRPKQGALMGSSLSDFVHYDRDCGDHRGEQSEDHRQQSVLNALLDSDLPQPPDHHDPEG